MSIDVDGLLTRAINRAGNPSILEQLPRNLNLIPFVKRVGNTQYFGTIARNLNPSFRISGREPSAFYERRQRTLLY